MAEKDDKTPADEKEPTFDDVEFEGEPAPEGDGGAADDGAGDERLGEREGVSVEGELAGETPDQKQLRRKAERVAKKERIRAERDELRETKAQLRRLEGLVEQLGGTVQTRIAGVEKKVAGGEITTIDNRLDVLRRMYANAEIAYDKAFTEGNAQESRRAADVMADAKAEYGRLAEQRKTLVAAPVEQREKPAAEQAQERPNPKVARLANAFIADFPDYDPEGSDEHSLIVQALDSAVTTEGFDPSTQDYWDELRERVLDRIPEWGDEKPKNGARRQAQNGRPRARATVQGTGRDGGGEGGGAKYVISKERVEAMKLSGAWDDPKKRAKQIEAFRKWDRENPQRSA